MNPVVLDPDWDTPRALSAWYLCVRKFYQDTIPALIPDAHEGLHNFSFGLKG